MRKEIITSGLCIVFLVSALISGFWFQKIHMLMAVAFTVLISGLVVASVRDVFDSPRGNIKYWPQSKQKKRIKEVMI